MNLGAYSFWDRIVLRMHLAKEVAPEEAPRLHAMIEESSHRAQISKPRVCILPEPQPNALATGRNPDHGVVAITEGMLNALEPREIRGVHAQEALSRSREYAADETGARLSGDPEAFASALLKLEQSAMAVPADATPATASLFIVNPLGAVERLSRLFSTHPSTDERVHRLMSLSQNSTGRPRLGQSVAPPERVRRPNKSQIGSMAPCRCKR